MNVLYIDACIRGEESRTAKLCQVALEEIQAQYPQAVVTRLELDKLGLLPLNRTRLDQRKELEHQGRFDDPMFDLGHQLAGVDLVVIGAPYWEASFPSVLRVYVEHVSVVNLTFGYTPEGAPCGLCQGERMLYITTAGGAIEDKNFGFYFLDHLFHLFGVEQTQCLAAEGLDVVGADVEGILREKEQELRRLIQAWAAD